MNVSPEPGVFVVSRSTKPSCVKLIVTSSLPPVSVSIRLIKSPIVESAAKSVEVDTDRAAIRQRHIDVGASVVIGA